MLHGREHHTVILCKEVIHAMDGKDSRMIKMVIGVYPGIRGGISGLGINEDGKTSAHFSMPVPTAQKQLDTEAIKFIFRLACESESASHSPSHILVAIEKAWPPLGSRIIGASGHCLNAGLIEGIAHGMGILVTRIAQRDWSAYYMSNLPCNASIEARRKEWISVAMGLYPEANLKEDDRFSRAESLLIAGYAARSLK